MTRGGLRLVNDMAIREAFVRGGMRVAIHETATQAIANLRASTAASRSLRRDIEEAMRNDGSPTAIGRLQKEWRRKREARRG